MESNVPISVVIPTFNRVSILATTIQKIYECSPGPSEIIVHIDGGDNETEKMLMENFAKIVVLTSKKSLGPGGGRNRGIRAARNEYVASFDDDSYPVEKDYFLRLYNIFQLIPDAALIESKIYHQNEMKPLLSYDFWSCHLFTGCGVAYRKEWFDKIGGYLPVTTAYGIEEVDFSIRATAHDALFIRTSWLTVFHDTKLEHHVSSKINSEALTNLGVLVYLRYPLSMWFYGVLQIFNRLVWALRHKRYNGLFEGIIKIPFKCYRLSNFRGVLPASVVKKFLKLRAIVNRHEPAA